MLRLYAAELKAGQAFMDGDCAGAETLQALLGSGAAEAEFRLMPSGWTRYYTAPSARSRKIFRPPLTSQGLPLGSSVWNPTSSVPDPERHARW